MEKAGKYQCAFTVAFTAHGHRSTELASQLSAFKLGVGVGHFYAYHLIEALGIDPELRTVFLKLRELRNSW